MTTEVMTAVRGDYQDSICKRARNRGHNDHAGAYLRYAEDLHGVMRGCFFFSVDDGEYVKQCQMESVWLAKD